MEREPAYRAVAANLSGSTPRELFEDVLEHLEGAFAEQTTALRDAVQALGMESKLLTMADGGELRAAVLAAAEGEQNNVLEALPTLPLYVLLLPLFTPDILASV